MRPFKTYTGGKAGAGTYQTIINEIPPIDKYIEPMVGGGGIFHNLKHTAVTVINDYDSSVAEKYKHLASDKLFVENTDYKQAIEKHSSQDNSTLIYFDPPYLPETCRSQKKYYAEIWDSRSHIDFIDYARSRSELIIISHYPCALYNDSLSDWRYIEYESMTRKGKAIEGLWLNYPKVSKLHDPRYLGSNFTERQAIKRKINRIASKLKALPPEQLQMILEKVATAGIDRNSYTAV